MLVFCDDGECGTTQFAWTETSLGLNAHPPVPYALDGQFGLINVNSGHWNKKVFPTPYTELWFSIFWRLTAFVADGKLLTWFNAASTELGSVRWNSSSTKLEIYTSTSTLRDVGDDPTPHDSVGGGFFNTEIRVLLHASTGSIEVYKEGSPVADCSFSGNTLPAGSNMDAFRVGAFLGNLGVVADCVWVNDTSGSVNNGRPGVVRNYTQRPTGDSATNNAYTGSAGGGKYLLVNEATADAANYVFSETTGQKQGFTYAAPSLPSNPQVKALVTNDLVRKDSAGGWKPGLRLGGTDHMGAAQVVNTSYTRESLQQHYAEVNPVTILPWVGTENPETVNEKT